MAATLETASANSMDELEEFVTSNRLVVADFFATWCKPCQSIKPYFSTLQAQYPGQIKFVLVDIDEAPDAAEDLGVETMPTFIFFKDGVEVSRCLGASQEKLGEAVNKFSTEQ